MEETLQGCIQCGRCTGGCPVSVRSALNIRKLIYKSLVKIKDKNKDLGIWECTTCSTCSIRCPKGVNVVDYIIDLRSYQIERGKVNPQARDALESVFKYGNPWGRIREKRTEWIEEGSNVKILKPGEKVEFLYYVGCTPCYDTRAQQIARSMVKVLNFASCNFGILGTKESCCGNEIKRMGELGLFEMLYEDNSKLFGEFEIGTLFTSSPHCYNTFRNEYPKMDFEIKHYTDVINSFMERGMIEPKGKFEKKVVFHDPCFLGKQNNIYEEPREILKRIPGIQLFEFDRCRERSLCCEGGGGRMWIESESDEERLAVTRVKSAAELGVDVIATACPFCLLTLEDAVKTAGFEGKIKIMDIIEILGETLEEDKGEGES
jgi:Fe-S oxidoreductase